jgi:glycosyltransferase involved in cell wall biosynthesis
MRSIISAFACTENRGSEHELGWRCLCAHAERSDDVHLLTNTFANPKIVEQIRANGLMQVQIHVVDFPRPVYRMLTSIPGMGYQLVAYAWEFLLFFYLFRRFGSKHFDLGVKSTYGSYRWPSFLWCFSQEFQMGPISGGGRFPLRFMSLFSLRSRLREFGRMLFQRLTFLDPFVLLTLWQASIIHVGNQATQDILPRFARKKCQIQQDFLAVNASDFRIEEAQRTVSVKSHCLKIFYTGKLLEWKGVILILRALAKLPSYVNYCFTIMGNGPARGFYQAYTELHNLDVIFIDPKGVPRADLSFYFLSHDLFVFPTLHGEAGFAPVEAKLHGMRLLTLDFSGLDFVIQPEDICIDTHGKQPRAVVAAISKAIESLYIRLKPRVVHT